MSPRRGRVIGGIVSVVVAGGMAVIAGDAGAQAYSSSPPPVPALHGSATGTGVGPAAPSAAPGPLDPTTGKSFPLTATDTVELGAVAVVVIGLGVARQRAGARRRRRDARQKASI